MPTVYLVMACREDQPSIAEPIVRLTELPVVGAHVSASTYAGPMQCRVRSVQPYDPPRRLSCGTQIDAAIVVEPAAPWGGR